MIGFGMAVTAPEIVRRPGPTGPVYCAMTSVTISCSAGKVQFKSIVMLANCTGTIVIRDIPDSGGGLLLSRTFTYSGTPAQTTQATWSYGEPVDVFYTSDTSVPGFLDVTMETRIAHNIYIVNGYSGGHYPDPAIG